MRMILITALAVLAAAGASAEQFTSTASIPPGSADWTETIQVVAFDPAWGVLTGVEVYIESDIAGEVRHENTGTGTATWDDLLQWSYTVALPNETVLITQAGSYVSFGDLDTYDGTLDFAGASGATEGFATGSNTGGMLPSVRRENFVGPGMMDLVVSIAGDATLNQTGDGSKESSLTAGATVTVVLHYSIGSVANESSSWSDLKSQYR